MRKSSLQGKKLEVGLPVRVKLHAMGESLSRPFSQKLDLSGVRENPRAAVLLIKGIWIALGEEIQKNSPKSKLNKDFGESTVTIFLLHKYNLI